MANIAKKRVLNAGSGPARPSALHEAFRGENWTEVRLDVERQTSPDIVGSFTDMHGVVGDAVFDAVYSSHSVEHLHAHQVLPAFNEFRRVLRGNGFALVTCPNLSDIAKLILKRGSDAIIYQSPAGPIKALDMLFGHGQSIAQGRYAMAHNTGFTAESFGRVGLESGFTEARVIEGTNYDLWGLFLKPQSNLTDISELFANSKLVSLFAENVGFRNPSESRLSA